MNPETRTVTISTAPTVFEQNSANTADEEELTLRALLDTIDAVNGTDVQYGEDGWPYAFTVLEEAEVHGEWTVVPVLYHVEDEPISHETLIADLNAYEGDNVWEDVIHAHGFDEEATNEVDPDAHSDRFATYDGALIVWDEQSRTWSVVRRGNA